MVCLALAACGTVPKRVAPAGSATAMDAGVPVYVVRRGWHVDVGMALTDLQPPLQMVAAPFPGSRYLLFGFGDRRYLVRGGNLLAALWPGPGIILATSLRTPQLGDAFGDENVIQLRLSTQQMRALQGFIWATLLSHEGSAKPLAPGPYPGSAYYEAVQRYSALHTCNTWAAEALKSGELPVESVGVEFAWQLWHQVQRLQGRALKLPPDPAVTRPT
jgi:hypothetical protein